MLRYRSSWPPPRKDATTAKTISPRLPSPSPGRRLRRANAPSETGVLVFGSQIVPLRDRKADTIADVRYAVINVASEFRRLRTCRGYSEHLAPGGNKTVELQARDETWALVDVTTGERLQETELRATDGRCPDIASGNTAAVGPERPQVLAWAKKAFAARVAKR